MLMCFSVSLLLQSQYTDRQQKNKLIQIISYKKHLFRCIFYINVNIRHALFCYLPVICQVLEAFIKGKHLRTSQYIQIYASIRK